MPLFRKGHSRGEFVSDFSWANAYAEHGLKYYPKLLSAVPFTPVRGPRLLIHPDADVNAATDALIKAAIEYAQSERLSSWHVLFPADDTAERLGSAGVLRCRDFHSPCDEHRHVRCDARPPPFTPREARAATH